LEIEKLLLAILNTPGLEIFERGQLMQAALWYVDKNVDFIDAYNAAWMVHQGLKTVYTFDRKHFARFEGFKVFTPGEDHG